MTLAGTLTQEQLELVFSHMPVGLSMADEDDVVRFWAGDTFATCHPKFIGRDLRDCHPKRAHETLERVLADLKTGAEDQIDTIERGKDGAERIIYSALRDADGTYRGVLETVWPLDAAPPEDAQATD